MSINMEELLKHLCLEYEIVSNTRSGLVVNVKGPVSDEAKALISRKSEEIGLTGQRVEVGYVD